MVASPLLNRSHKLAILIFFFLNLLLLFAFRQVQPFHVLLFIILFLVWCFPGYLFAMIASRAERRGPFFWIRSIVAGYHLSSIFALLIVQLFTVPIWLLAFLMACVLLSLFLIFHDRILSEINKFRFPRRGIEVSPLSFILILSTIFIFLIIFPHTQAGKTSADGLQYHDLYSTVFFKHVSITSELTKNIPPENPFFFGEKLHYYWLFYIFPAIAHNALNIPIEEALFLLTWAITITALFSILILIHAFSTRTTDLLMAATPLLFAYSYDGIIVLANLQQSAQPLSKFTSVNIDAAARTYLSTPEVIGVYRAFVFDPHHMFAICLMTLSFLLFKRSLHKPSWIVAASALFLLGAIAGHSAFIAYTAVSWIVVWLTIELIRGKASFLMDKKFIISALGIISFYTFIYFGSPGLYETDSSNLDFGLLPKSSGFMFIDFGALLILGSLGLFLAIKKKDDRVLPIAILLVVGLIQLFFTFFPEWPNDLSMKTGHSISIALACLGAHFFSKQASGSKRRRIAKLGFAFLILPALPT
ncbi:MAG TPA: hypothetical protein VLH08_13515, partial [Acidobacteriota bacterium]|nr:hypothetical protein [Acidobacteriota bacterium]